MHTASCFAHCTCGGCLLQSSVSERHTPLSVALCHSQACNRTSREAGAAGEIENRSGDRMHSVAPLQLSLSLPACIALSRAKSLADEHRTIQRHSSFICVYTLLHLLSAAFLCVFHRSEVHRLVGFERSLRTFSVLNSSCRPFTFPRANMSP
jgi:hypothetical protein